MNPEGLKIVCVFSLTRLENAITGDIYDLPFCKNRIRKPGGRYLFISESNVTDDYENENWDIVLVRQEHVDLSDNRVFNEKSLVMYHNNIKNDKNESIDITPLLREKKVMKFKSGHHEPRPEDGFALLKDLIESRDKEDKKFIPAKYKKARKKLLDWFELKDKLTTVLEYLHFRLGGRKTPLQNLLNGGFTEADFEATSGNGASARELIKKLDEEKSGNACNDIIKKLRDALLERV